MTRLDQFAGRRMFPPLRHRLFILIQPRVWQVWVLIWGVQLAGVAGYLIARRLCACRESGSVGVVTQLGRECAIESEAPPKEE